jgi:hypothetical protein
MENVDSKDDLKRTDNRYKHEIYSTSFKAGRRTYFFDVKSTRSNEYFITITESKKLFSEQGRVQYEKHKIFLYREDFEIFSESLNELISFINKTQPDFLPEDELAVELITEEKPVKDYTNIDFEDI